MERTSGDDLPAEEGIEKEEETLEQALPFKEYAEESSKLKALFNSLDQEYDKREKVINRIMEYGTGIETEKGLRMYPTSVLEKWEASLSNFRATQLKKA